MGEYKRRALLSAIVALSLLACFYAPALTSSNNTKTFASSTTAPDLVVQDITWSPEAPLIGDKVTFTVTIKNQGNSQADFSYAAYYIDNTYQASTYTSPVEPGETTSCTFNWTAQAGSHSVRAVADANSSIDESDETNNDKTFAISIFAPDLVIESITWSPENPSIGDVVDFSIIIKNQGNSRANCSNIDFHIDDISRGYKSILWLDPGATVNETYKWTALPGIHTVTAIADLLNQISESDENNNEKSVTYATATPDLIIDSITWSPQNPSEDTEVTLKITVKNQGSGKADYSRMAYYIDNTLQTVIHVNRLDAGAKVTNTFPWTVEASSHSFKAVADATDRVIESDEGNNTKTIDLPAPSPDLIIQDITCSPSSPLIAHRVTFNVTIKNQGKSTAYSPCLNLNISDAYKFEYILESIAAGASVNKSIPWTSQSSSLTIKAVVDERNYIRESNEDNNDKSVTISFSHPSPVSDLIIEDITWYPEEPAIGDVVTFTVTIKNQGKKQAGTSRTAVYVDDTLLISASVSQIDANTTVTNTVTWEAMSGPHTIKAVADTNDSVFETDENNNEKAVTLSASAPDLVILGATWSPERPSAGDTVTFDVMIKNQGDEIADSSYISYYIDDDYRGNHYVEEIDPGATVTKTFMWTAQAESHIIKVVADIENLIPESNENNNGQTVTIPAPDLVIDEITWSQAGPSENITVTFNVTVRNRGGSRSDYSLVSYYVNDTLLTLANIGQLNPGATAQSTFIWETQTGLYTLKTVADAYNDMIESDETNNEKVITISVAVPQAPPPAPDAETTLLATTDLNQPEEDAELLVEDSVVPSIQDMISQDVISDVAEEPALVSSPWWEGFMLSWWFIAALVASGSIAILILLRLRKRSQSAEDISDSESEPDT